MTFASVVVGKVWGLPPRLHRVRVDRAQNVTMRDGVALLTDLFIPVGQEGVPTVLLRSPYGRGHLLHLLALAFAERGYIVVLQSVRGTFGSGGTFNPFFQERDDGLDTVDWIERQPWYKGKLGLYGVSYLGLVQWAIAAELGERVSAISLDRTTTDFAAAILDGGGFRLEDFLSWARALTMQERTNPFAEAFRRMIFGDPLAKDYARLPLRRLDEMVVGESLQFWRDWVDHDLDDTFWDPIRFRESLPRVSAPVNMTAGWSDLFIDEQFQDYHVLKSAGRDVRLTIDEGTHAGTGSQGARLRSALEWFDRHLKGVGVVSGGADSIRVRMNGQKAWRDVAEWPRLEDGLCLYLDADGQLSAEARSGESVFCWSPAEPTPSKEGPTLFARTGRGDMRSLAARDDVLTFTGSALEYPVDILGEPIVEIEVSADAPAHDLFVCLCDVSPDGRTTNICDGYVRLPPVESATRRNVKVRLQPTGWRVQGGHRLLLLVCGGAFPRYARHLGTVDPIGSGTTMREVNVTVHTGPTTKLRVPVD